MSAPQIKLLTIGDSGVGKTCLLLQYTNNSFSPMFITTIGIDYKLKTIDVEGHGPIKMQIWDTAGQERFRTITASYFRGAHGILMVYDVSSRATFESVRVWMDMIQQQAETDIPCILVGNKCDLPPEQVVVTESEGRTLAEEFSIPFHLASAKCDTGVDEVRLCVCCFSLQHPLYCTALVSYTPPTMGYFFFRLLFRFCFDMRFIALWRRHLWTSQQSCWQKPRRRGKNRGRQLARAACGGEGENAANDGYVLYTGTPISYDLLYHSVSHRRYL